MEPFFEKVREIFGPLRQTQVDGLNVLLDATFGMSVQHRAYILATAWHETGPKSSELHMTPRTEVGPRAYFDQYEPPGAKAKDLGNTLKGDGYLYRGRGYVQLTGRRNYTVASGVLGLDLVKNPDKAKEPAIAARIMVSGMTHGWFTGKALRHYATYQDMRRVVNGTDKAEQIAEYAAGFERALLALTAEVGPPPEAAPRPIPEVRPEPVRQVGLFKFIVDFLVAIFKRSK